MPLARNVAAVVIIRFVAVAIITVGCGGPDKNISNRVALSISDLSPPSADS